MMSSCTPAAEREEGGVTSGGYLHPYSRERVRRLCENGMEDKIRKG
jgi:hypothetical protein